MAITLKEAERRTGLSRSALLKAIKNGRLSASRDARGGQWVVDVAELARVYPEAAVELSKPENVSVDPSTEVVKLREQVIGLENLVLSLNDSIDDHRATTQDLRERLTVAESERNKLTLMISHQASQPVLGKSQTGHKWLIALLALILLVLSSGVLGKYLGLF